MTSRNVTTKNKVDQGKKIDLPEENLEEKVKKQISKSKFYLTLFKASNNKDDYDKMKSYQSEACLLQEKLMDLTDETLFIEDLVKLAEKIKEIETEQVPVLSTKVESKVEPKIYLEKEKIEKFDGTVHKYPAFWTKFKSLIHENDYVDEAQKLRRLKDCLEEDPQGLISHLEDYSEAVKILAEHYMNPTLMKNSILKSVKSLPSIVKANSENVLSLVVKLQSFKSKLLNVIPENDSFFDLIVGQVLTKIPKYIKYKFYEEKLGTLDNLIKVLNEQHQVLAIHDKFNSDSFKSSAAARSPSRESFVNLTNIEDRENCLFCNSSDHQASRCNKSCFEKKRIVMEKALCFRCLKPNHQARECNKKFECRKCKENHLTFMCSRRPSQSFNQGSSSHQFSFQDSRRSPSPQQQLNQPSSSQQQTSNYPQSNNHQPMIQPTQSSVQSQTIPKTIDSRVNTFSTHVVNQVSSTVTNDLPIVNVKVQNKRTKVLLDMGSQSTLVSQKLIDELNIPTYKDDFHISVFNRQFCLNSYAYLNLCNMEQPNTSVKVKAYVSDIFPEKFEVLLGVDYLPRCIVSTESVQNQSKLLIKTVFGSTTCGSSSEPKYTPLTNPFSIPKPDMTIDEDKSTENVDLKMNEPKETNQSNIDYVNTTNENRTNAECDMLQQPNVPRTSSGTGDQLSTLQSKVGSKNSQLCESTKSTVKSTDKNVNRVKMKSISNYDESTPEVTSISLPPIQDTQVENRLKSDQFDSKAEDPVLLKTISQVPATKSPKQIEERNIKPSNIWFPWRSLRPGRMLQKYAARSTKFY